MTNHRRTNNGILVVFVQVLVVLSQWQQRNVVTAFQQLQQLSHHPALTSSSSSSQLLLLLSRNTMTTTTTGIRTAVPKQTTTSLFRSSTVRQKPPLVVAFSTMVPEEDEEESSSPLLQLQRQPNGFVGDDAAYFDWSQQTVEQWLKFTAATSTVLLSLTYIWIELPFIGGMHGGDWLLQNIQSNSFYETTDPAVTITLLLSLFAIVHSGMAGLRTYIEPIIGARIWRVIFAVFSLPLALSCISYFVNHAHDGIQYWDVSQVPYIHTFLYIVNFISFLFLYPSTFNLLEIAAITPPQLHLYETGIIRITRHPQAMGQIAWCCAHTLYLGTSTAIAASTILIAHHLFSIYHGDRRLISRHGLDKFTYIQKQTSIVPFAAILDGRQQLPPDYYKEFLRLPYAVVVVGTMIAYIGHPYMQAGAALLHW